MASPGGPADSVVRVGLPPAGADSVQRTKPSLGRELLLGLVVFGLYLLVTHGLRASGPAAAAHGRQLLHAERWLHLDVERTLDRQLAPHHILGALAAWEYALTYIVTTFGVLFWVYARRPAAYRYARNLLIASTLLALAVFVLWPVAPPRLLGAGFTDVVAAHHPFLSWGGGTVSAGADVLAAMPSLHVGWAMWVTVVTLHPAVRRTRAGPAAIGLAVLHLALTTYVVLATGNHYVLDVIGGVLVVAVPMAVMASLRPLTAAARSRAVGRAGRPDRQRVAAPDSFFWYVETDTVPQHVGGLAMLDTSRVPVSVSDVRALVAERLDRLPRLQARLVPGGRLRGPRWVREPDIDLKVHVVEHRLPAPGGRDALMRYVASLAEQRISLDRPPWRLHVAQGVAPGETAVVAVMHHAIADGLGVVDILRQLFDPCLPPAPAPAMRRVRWLKRAAAAAAGIAQLACDGSAQRNDLVGPSTPHRGYVTVSWPLHEVQAVARTAGVRVTDVMLSVTADVLARILAERGSRSDGVTLRVAVPVTLRPPAPPGTGRTAVPGNLTAALRIDVPVDPQVPQQRLAAVHRSAERMRRSARAMGSLAVMHGLGLLPGAAHRWCCRAIYNAKFFGAIATNMPGPSVRLSFAGAPMKDVYPIVPLADRVPLSVGALGWNGTYCLSVVYDSGLLPELAAGAPRFDAAFQRLRDDVLPPAGETAAMDVAS